MRLSLLPGGPVAALLLALGAAACAAQPASPTPAASKTSSPATASAAPSPGPSGLAALSGLAGARLTSLALASPRLGYGLFISQAGSRCRALSGRTAGSGARFRSASLITSWNCDNAAPVSWIAADSAGDAFAYGPALFIARNAAGPWLSSPQRGTVLAVSAAGRSVWMLLARCRGAAMSADGCALRLVESVNGGRTWKAAKSEPPGGVTRGSVAGSAFGSAAGQTWLVRAGTSAGYLLASPAVSSRGTANSAALWYTGDAGASWSRRRIPCGIDALSVTMARSPGGALAAVCAAEPTAGLQVKTTAVSLNGGRTWTVRAGCLSGARCRNPLYDGYLAQVAAVSSRVIYLVGDRSSLLVTTDGGLRWRAVSPLAGDTSGGTYQVIFFGRADGIVLGQGASTEENIEVFRTSDGGRTWSKEPPRLS